jgi:hypothetical protein
MRKTTSWQCYFVLKCMFLEMMDLSRDSLLVAECNPQPFHEETGLSALLVIVQQPF